MLRAEALANNARLMMHGFQIPEDIQMRNKLLIIAEQMTGPVNSYISNIPTQFWRLCCGEEHALRGPCAQWCSDYTEKVFGEDLFVLLGGTRTNEDGTFRLSVSGGEVADWWTSWIWSTHYYVKVERGHTVETITSTGLIDRTFHPEETFYLDNGVLGGKSGYFYVILKWSQNSGQCKQGEQAG